MFLSIVIPIYNIESYIEKLVTSIIKQIDYSLKVEIILVDDGSTDNSPKICDFFEAKYTCIKVIHKKNGGLSDARNAGIDISQGKYLFFVDGDDTVADGALKAICESLIDEDLLVMNQIRIRNNTYERHHFPKKVNNSKNLLEIIKDFTNYKYGIPWAAYQNIIKRELVQKNNIYFKKNLIGAEDCDFFFRYIEIVNTFQIIDIPSVNYLMTREDSITNFVKVDAVEGKLLTFAKLFRKYCDSEELSVFFAKKYCNAITDISKLDNSYDEKKIIDNIQLNGDIIAFASKSGISYWTISFIWKVFGYRKGSTLITAIISVKKY